MMILGKTLEDWTASHPLIRELVELKETSWFNPATAPTAQALGDARALSDEVAAGAEQRDEIYWQWADELLAMVRQTPEGAHTVVVVGHEPTVSSLVALAAAPGLDIPRGMPTGSAVILSGAAEWERWAEGTATEAVFVH